MTRKYSGSGDAKTGTIFKYFTFAEMRDSFISSSGQYQPEFTDKVDAKRSH